MKKIGIFLIRRIVVEGNTVLSISEERTVLIATP